MKFRRQFILKIKERRGAVSIIMAIMVFFVLIGLMALAIDVGYLYATKNELQNIADGAALAAAGELGDQLSNGETLNDTDIKDAAIKIGEGNQAGGKTIFSLGDKVEIGTWDQDADPKFVPEATPPNAVRVTARRAGTGTTNEAVKTFFAAIFGVHSVDVSADATAALLPPRNMEPIPVGISRYWFEYEWPGGFCNQPIRFHPTGGIEGCAGWHNYYDPDNPEKSNANANQLKTILEGLKTGDFTIPETIVGKTKYAFIGGDVASVFTKHGQELSPIEALYDSKKGNCCEDPDLCPNDWCAAVVVYDRDDCSNPNKSITIVGFAPVIITGILGPPQKTIEGRVLCDKVVWAQGESGEYYGYLTGIPRLVE
jgi:Flp pilus assembly protein TadG